MAGTPETHHHIFFPAVANVRIHIVGQALYRTTMIKRSGSVVAALSSTFPPFSHTSYYSAVQCSRHCVWPRISHIWHLSSPPLYPSLPTCPQRHPSLVKKFLLLRNISKEASSVARFATLFNSSWLKGLTYCLLHNFPCFFSIFCLPHIFQSSCSLIRSQISTVRKK